MTIRVIIVDDEAVARRGIRQRLRDASDIDVVAECDDGAGAIAAISELKPDLVFLDLQMPGLGGFEVIESIGLARMPAVIFVTAFDQFAVRAFDVHAVDYILKPIDGERFALALQRARTHLQRAAEPPGESIAAVLRELNGTALRPWSKRIAIRSVGRIILVDVHDIEYCEAAGNYVEVHAGAKAHMVRETLAGLESRLDPGQFVRISRSAIVNIERVRELHPMFSGDFVALMADGTRVSGSRRFREPLEKLLR